MSTSKKMYATRDFRDAGTGRAFGSGAEITDASAGELGNYEAAGLVSDKKLEPTKASDAA